MTNRKIYAVSAGSYSNYGIVALFSTEEAARLFMERHSGTYSDYNDIEEYDLDCGVEQMREGYARWFVQMDKDGVRSSAEIEWRGSDAKPDDAFRAPVGHWAKQPWFNWHGWAKDQQHALKIANEHRIGLLARASLTVTEQRS